MTPSQRRALERLWPRYGLPDSGPIDPAALFGPGRPVTLEIGFGNGESLAAMAAAAPEAGFLGIEVHRPGIGHLLLAIERAGLTNLRLLEGDAVTLLGQRLAPASLDRILVFFPDPWPKQRHHKRRLIQPPFARLLAERLRPGGLLHLATDWEDYARQMLAVLDAEPLLSNQAGRGRFSPRPPDRPLTRFERRGQRLGHGTRDLLYRRLPVRTGPG